ncbi:DEAD/DEAH box helicase [Salinibacterium sp. dk2585]|uniref:DEAD/DEAH box helicase n=1 Tax=unclassified Salinibacterium TaxID=2632331 RepID=UPI0011C24AAF|nr:MULTISPECIES: DEAD/DEAH box helicase [unclassified Salinibacterium]QEE60473.1 DEAD/DEAH box helicase [Salinibacterium sp. dk2585]TXK55545.1 DEAD/DEAH box helicase [Salinibacterium sp. dk5596]
MPNSKKLSAPRTGGAKFGARSASGSKAGSRSPGHRGYKADAPAAAAPKKRWTADDRAARTGDRRPSGDRRPDWTPREERPTTGRAPYGDRAQRTERPSYGRTERPSYNDRPARGERPAYNRGENRSERPSYGDRPARGERPSYGDRPNRTERPSYGDRTERPSYGDRPQRGSYDRPQRNSDDRPKRSFDDRAPRRDFDDRAPRSERPSYGDRPTRGERPAYNRGERPAYGDRPQRSFDDRPKRSFDDRAPRRDFDDRAPRRDFSDRAPRRDVDDRAPRRSYDERPPRRDSDLYPKRETRSFTPHDDVVLEKLEAKVVTAGEVEGKTFGDLGIGDNITRQLAAMGAEAPFPIQAATIPDVLAGRDVLGRGKTGSGKTIAFGAPLVERLMENNGGKGRKPGRKPRALILAPTRELAMQIDRTVQPIARSVGLFTTTIVGGVPQHKQVMSLQRGVDIVIATPGRVEDLVDQGRLDLSEVKVTVLDEADHMCDLGFLEPVQRILRETMDGGQKLLFSATLDKGVAQLVNEFLVDPAVHEVAGEDQASSTIDHKVLLIEQRDKRAVIEQLAGGEGKKLVFARTRAFAEELADMLEDAGIPATSLHGDLNQGRRTRNLQLLTSGRVNVLVATDVAARGIHVDDISLVIQADAPDEYKTYLHRAGRTGRAGKVGTVVTLTTRNRQRRIDELLGRAEIDATMHHVAPGDELLDQLAGL